MTRTLPRSEKLPYALYRAAQVREFDRIAIQDFGSPGSTPTPGGFLGPPSAPTSRSALSR